MKYTHTIKHNGVLYKAGAEVPAFFTPKTNTEQIKIENNSQSYTKTEINRMSKDDLVALAIEQGIENAEETSGADLKKALIDKFGL